METLVLKNRLQSNVTLLANDFIDNYMPKANGELVKVYLFLLRHIDDSGIEISIPLIADYLNHTESDIMRAFKYWEAEGLLQLERDKGGNITGLELGSMPDSPIGSTTAPEIEDNTIPIDSYKAQKETIKNEKEIKTVLHIAELYLGKTLTATEIDTILYLFEGLEMDSDLIEYLIGSCVDNGHKSIHYIKKVAFDWSEKGITTVEAAVAEALNYSKAYTTILHTFGIRNRGPATQEIDYIKKWTLQYGLSLEIIIEACNRTITKTSQPSFKYADSILGAWHENSVRNIDDILALDERFRQKCEANRPTQTNKNTTTAHKETFEQREYDWDSYEEDLIAHTKRKHKYGT
ncbi:MAG: DnaD domain protein [Lachnospiraceae bacterium]|nr:DnaD domain protein [Lachnospiraceae bacterium]